MRSNKKGIIIISIILVIIIAAAVLAYLFFMTDILKSNRELFGKYFAQNLQALEESTDFKISEIYQILESKKGYESNIKIDINHSEGGEVSNPLNNLSAKLDTQRDDIEEYFYANGQILFENEEILKTEIIKDKGNYGARFTDVKQFVSVKKDEKLATIAEDIGVNAEQLEMILNTIDKSKFTTGEEIPQELKEKYMNIITTAISNGTFGKQKNALITYNNATIETNAYSVSLSNEQVANLLVEILNNVKNETEILEKSEAAISQAELTEQIDEMVREIKEELEMPSIKITVYEKQQKNIRTDIEIGADKIVIENTKQEAENKSKIKYIDVNDEQIIQYECEISKPNTGVQGEFKISLKILDGEKEDTIALINKVEKTENLIKINTTISHTEQITTTSIEMQNEIKIGTDFEKQESLIVGNYIPLNEMKADKRKELINLLKEIVPQKITEKIMLLATKFMTQELPNTEIENIQSENTEVDEEMSQVEINKFNAKFEFYTGDEVSAENVKKLLDVVKDNINGHSIITMGEEDDAKVNINVFVKKDSTKDESITQVLEKINDNKKYKVSISYNEENGLIENITIAEL